MDGDGQPEVSAESNGQQGLSAEPHDSPTIGVGMGGACPKCKSPIELSQRFCLQCGAPVRFSKRDLKLPPSQRLQQNRAPFPWKPFLIVLGIVAIGLGVAIWDSSKPPKKDTATATESTESTIDGFDDLTDTETGLETVPTTTATTDTSPFPTTPTTATTPTTTATTSTSATSWPSGQSGWTVILASLKKDRYSEDDANQRAVDAQGDGVSAGVLSSDDFSNLQEGLWVVFSGVYTSESEAESHLSEVKSAGYEGAYVRQIQA